MEYRVIITSNIDDKVHYRKTLYICKKRATAFIRFHKLKEENKVFYPKKFIKNKKIKAISFNICVSKITEPTDEFRVLRDRYGRIYTEKPLGDWTILTSDDYFIEEKFYLYGYNGNGDRQTIKEVVKRLVTGGYAKNMVKQILVVYNKLIIYNENQFDMIICKNLEDAQRLHHTLDKIARKQKIKSLMFMGTAGEVMRNRMYDLIQEKTGWTNKRIRRTSTVH